MSFWHRLRQVLCLHDWHEQKNIAPKKDGTGNSILITSADLKLLEKHANLGVKFLRNDPKDNNDIWNGSDNVPTDRICLKCEKVDLRLQRVLERVRARESRVTELKERLTLARSAQGESGMLSLPEKIANDSSIKGQLSFPLDTKVSA